jgi:hypothetical protein
MSVATPRKAASKEAASKKAASKKAASKKAAHRRRSQPRRSRPVVVRARVAVVAALIWAALLLGALSVATAAVAVVMVPVALVAALSARRADRRRRVPAWQRYAAVAGPLEAAICLIVARGQGASLGLALAVAVMAFDAGAFVMGNGRGVLGGPLGVAGGVASLAVVAVFVAAIMNPPFSGYRPWIVFGLMGVLAPAGVKLCDLTVAGARLPALRRLDSLVLAAPVWVICLAVLANR